ncbi:SDR family oxidoreductase [Candidatus Pelagibacter bacterium]|nr:SDR family oxidoreductase [Candidatus Pelagibacter bacterium]MDA8844888.1 SDR family oxidoreductase [Candidatus Pelagibacter bacterium]
MIKSNTKQLHNLFHLNKKVIIVTGALGLLGQKHVEVIAQNGGIPIILDIDERKVRLAAKKIEQKYHVPALGLKVDITDEKMIIESCNKIIKQYRHIDGLVNNAANNPKVEENKGINFSKLENFPIEIWNKDIAVGLTGAWLCSKHYGSAIAKNKKGGSIVNISSDLGLISPDQRLYMKHNETEQNRSVKPVTYSVVKSGLIGLTKYLSTYWVDKGVRCNAMCPGGVENGQSDEFLDKIKTRIPMGRLAKSHEYQGTLLWMLSDASSYLNGAVVPVDGGRTAW